MGPPVPILSLLLNEGSKIHTFVELIGFCARIADPTLVIEVLGHLMIDQLATSESDKSLTFITFWLSILRYILPSFCSSTVVKGKGLHLLVGFLCTLDTLAVIAARHRSKIIITDPRSNSRLRRHENCTLISSRIWSTLMLQNLSGTKFLTRKYRSTTNPSVGN